MRVEDVRFAGEGGPERKHPLARSQNGARGPGLSRVPSNARGVFAAGTPEECVPSLQPANQQLALIDHFRRQPIV
jgi:hypothetical protein